MGNFLLAQGGKLYPAQLFNRIPRVKMAADPKFPDDPILSKFVWACLGYDGPEPMIHDIEGFSKGYSHLLGDILATRQDLLGALPETVLGSDKLLKDQYPYIFLFCQSGYEFLVGFFAIRAIGGAVMPLGGWCLVQSLVVSQWCSVADVPHIAIGILPEEARHFHKSTKAACILVGKDCGPKAAEIRADILSANTDPISFTSCSISTSAPPFDTEKIEIDTTKTLSPDGPGVVFLTSGTSGPPKAAVLPRQSLALQNTASSGGAGINFRPGHWIGGADTMILPILAGQSLHCIGQNAGVDEILQAFLDHRITHTLLGAPLLPRLKDAITGPSGVLSDEARLKYGNIFRGMSTIRCGGGNVDPEVRDFWTDLTGLAFENFYASTEVGARVCSSISGSYVRSCLFCMFRERNAANMAAQGCIGVPIEGVRMKLSEEPVGEILVKTATCFTQ